MSAPSRVGRWGGRPWLAASLRLAAQAIPIALSVGVVYAASSLVPAPAGSPGPFIAWWAVLSALATLVFVVAGRVSRRLLPLAALMKLSLVFPDAAPSRFRLALGSGTVASLEKRLAEARRGVGADTPTEAAERLLALVALLDTHDALTRGHSERVRAYSQSIGRELGLDRAQLELLNWAALLHDVGKLDVPREILTKRGRPTEEEWVSLREHPVAGARLAASLRDWLGEWGDAIEQHHERWDGGGYPRGLVGTDISLAARIVAVADVFDVITSSRTYKEPSSPTAARMEITRCAGSQFDPEVVRAFLAISVRRGRLAGALAWLANAAVLVRLPTQAAGTLSAGALAVGVGVSAGLAPPSDTREDPRPERARPTLASAATGATTAGAVVPARPAERPKRPRARVAEGAAPARATHAPRSEGAVRSDVENVPNDTAARPEPVSASPQTAPVQAPAETLGSDVPPTALPPVGSVLPALPEPPPVPEPPRPAEAPRLPELPALPPVLPSLPELPPVPQLLPSAPSLPQPPVPPPLPSLPQSQVPPLPAPLPSLPEAPPLPLVGG